MRSISRDARALHDRFLALARRRPLRDPLAAACEELGLGPPQLHALLWLGREGTLTMGELARRVAVTEKTVTGLVDRLERDGYLQRARDAADRRVVHVTLAPKGAEVHRLIDRGLREKLARLLSLLDAEDRAALLRILDTLISRLDEPPHGKTPTKRRHG